MIAKTDLFVDSFGRLVDGNDVRAAILVARAGKQVPDRFVAAVKAGEKPVAKQAAPKATKESKPKANKSA